MELVFCFSFTCLGIHKSSSKLEALKQSENKNPALQHKQLEKHCTIMLMPAAGRASYPRGHRELALTASIQPTHVNSIKHSSLLLPLTCQMSSEYVIRKLGFCTITIQWLKAGNVSFYRLLRKTARGNCFGLLELHWANKQKLLCQVCDHCKLQNFSAKTNQHIRTWDLNARF